MAVDPTSPAPGDQADVPLEPGTQHGLPAQEKVGLPPSSIRQDSSAGGVASDTTPSASDDADILDGGNVSFNDADLEDFDFQNIVMSESNQHDIIAFTPEVKHRADTARNLAYGLISILGGSFVIQALGMFMAASLGLEKIAESMTTLYTAWLPAITGLVSSAVTYYFTKESASSRSR